MRLTRTCASLSAMAIVGLPLAARAAARGALPVFSSPFSSIWSSKPLFQSPFKSKTVAAAEADRQLDTRAEEPTAGPHDSNILAVYVTVPDIEQGMFCHMLG